MALDVLADPTRRSVFERLRSGPLPVGELTNGLAVSRPAVSQHLKVLLDAGLVGVDQVGTRRYYRVEREGLSGLRTWVESFWDEPLERFRSAAEKRARSGR